ncbi:MAG: hypothetical protein Tsb0034_06350 [Ekhidna sp.]
MKRFKLIFHIIYVIVSVAIIYFSIDILMNTEQYLSKIKLSSYIKFPRYVMGVFLFVSILMVIEYAVQQISIFNIKNNIEDLENEITQLKAKLYDKSQSADAETDPEGMKEAGEEEGEDTE